MSGIGFLGAGTIIQARGTVIGLTTAATLWVVSAIGIAVGAGQFIEAIGTTVLVLVALLLLGKVETRIIQAKRQQNLVVQTVKSWDEVVRQVSDSRMLGGVHYRFSNDAGEEIGRKAARIVVGSLLRPLPAKRKR